jgi:hypothetical protein
MTTVDPFQSTHSEPLRLFPDLILPWGLMLVFSLGMVGAAIYLFIYSPPTYVMMITEDSFVEFATFSAYLLAAGGFAYRSFQLGLAHSIGYSIVVLGCAVIGMEEISWGGRMLEYEASTYFVENNFQGETNLHNLFRYRGFVKLFSLAVLAWAIVWPLLLRAKVKPVEAIQRLLVFPLVAPYLWPAFVVVLFFMAKNIPPRGEEIYEMYLGLLFAMTSLQHIQFPLRKASLILLSLLVAALLSWSQFSTAKYVQTMNKASEKFYPRAALCLQTLPLYDAIDNLGGGTASSELNRIKMLSRLEQDLQPHLQKLLEQHSGDSLEQMLFRAQILLAVGKIPSATEILSDIRTRMADPDVPLGLTFNYIDAQLQAGNITVAEASFEAINAATLTGVQQKRYLSIQRDVVLGSSAPPDIGRLRKFIYVDVFGATQC